MKKRNMMLVLEYEGSAFYGFQRQPRHRTVQQVLEEALSRLFNGPVRIGAASGRTDSGVHARGQVVHVKVPASMSPEKIHRGLNALLPPDVAVCKIRQVPDGFHARYGARRKIYEYRIWNKPFRSPLEAGRSLHVSQPLDLKAMEQAAGYLSGRHDFRSFCASDPARRDRPQDTVRTLYRLTVKKNGGQILIRAEGDGFLYRMVRNLVGTLIEVGQGKVKPESMPVLLRSRNRCRAGATVPPQGLCLIRVKY